MTGDFTKQTFVNGASPAINATNLNNIENKVKELDTDLASGAINSLDVNKKIIWTLSKIGRWF